MSNLIHVTPTPAEQQCAPKAKLRPDPNTQHPQRLLQDMLMETLYHGYSYAYPHKTAYRPLQPPVSLQSLWSGENRDALFLYLHVPFCEMRCGFCNLFTTANPRDDFTALYLDAMEREAQGARESLGSTQFARMAIGGGTPTYLDPTGLRRLFHIAENVLGADLETIPISVETSPHTATKERLLCLWERRVSRISIGVQSFIELEAASAGRPQKTVEVKCALDRIREMAFPVLNIDLIYGIPGQTVESWLHSLQAAMYWNPEELYLYPLYVRPLTGLDRRWKSPEDHRLALYRTGRSFLLAAGYSQVSMRMFRLPEAPANGIQKPSNPQPLTISHSPTLPLFHSSTPSSPVYCCQEDGMVGIGCGARSYTRGLHYSSEYAVGASGVRSILESYVTRQPVDFDSAHYGYRLDPEDQRRRYVIKSLLQADGLQLDAYQSCFNSKVIDDLPELYDLIEADLAVLSGNRLQLTERGLERSDTIGPWLYSAKAAEFMDAYELK